MVLVEKISKIALYTKDVQLYLNLINVLMVLVPFLKIIVILPLFSQNAQMELIYVRMDYVERNVLNLMDVQMKNL